MLMPVAHIQLTSKRVCVACACACIWICAHTQKARAHLHMLCVYLAPGVVSVADAGHQPRVGGRAFIEAGSFVGTELPLTLDGRQ